MKFYNLNKTFLKIYTDNSNFIFTITVKKQVIKTVQS